MSTIIKPQSHLRAFKEIVGLLTRHRQLTWEMVKREISDRYAGQVLGTLWTIGHPLILMAIYVFIFTVIFKQKTGGTFELPRDFTTYLLSGLIPWMAFQESMMKSPTVIISYSNLVKQVVFPIEILPVKGVIASVITQLISTVILIIYVLISHGAIPLTYLLIPVIFFFQILAMIGVAYILSSIGVYLRDMKEFVQVFCLAGFYLLPLFYLPSQFPRVLMPAFYVNPFYYLVLCWRDVLYFGRFENLWAWPVFVIGSLVVFTSGYALFRRLRTMFGNVL